jgi:FtsP/CotA-like multicopper oxidase with cupredoxin domain
MRAVRSGLVLLTTLVAAATSARSDSGPGNLRVAADLNPDPRTLEIELVGQVARVDLDGRGLMANAWTFNGAIPGPELRLRLGDLVIAHFTNRLPEPISVHFHGIELDNANDGTTVTQDPVQPGSSFTYRFRVTRPGIFWYHPHAMMPTDQVFRGLYGTVVVEDPAEGKLVARRALPQRSHTLVLSDITVCKTPGANDKATFPPDPSLPWVFTGKGLGPFPGLTAFPAPADLCENPRDTHGHATGTGALAAGDIPGVQPPADCGGKVSCRVNEGQLVLANGVVAAPRAGSPEKPGTLSDDAPALDVRSGEGLRLRLVNAAVSRYFRLRLTDQRGRPVTLYRVGGEGGLLDHVRVEGGKAGTLDLKYDPGEIVLANADRAEIALVVPDGKVGDVLTLWTLDYQRYGTTEYPYGYGALPSVPVAHLRVIGKADRREPMRIAAGDPLRAHPAVNDPVRNIRSIPITAHLQDPRQFKVPLPGTAEEVILFTVVGLRESVDGIHGTALEGGGEDYRKIPMLPSSRHAVIGDLLELTLRNGTQVHHPLHLHGFSFQPVRLLDSTGNPVYEYDYNEFMDTIDIPATNQLVFRVRLEDRPVIATGAPGGAAGRWMLHCHIFNHAGVGMMAELVVNTTAAPGGD